MRREILGSGNLATLRITLNGTVTCRGLMDLAWRGVDGIKVLTGKG